MFFFGSIRAPSATAHRSNSLSSGVLIAPDLNDDRSEQTLRRTFNVPSVNPIALALLNVKLPNGRFLIPTPQANGRFPARLSRLIAKTI